MSCSRDILSFLRSMERRGVGGGFYTFFVLLWRICTGLRSKGGSNRCCIIANSSIYGFRVVSYPYL